MTTPPAPLEAPPGFVAHGAMKVVQSVLAVDSRMVVALHSMRKRRRRWTVRRETRPGIFISDVLRTIYVHPAIYEQWQAGNYRRGNWKANPL